MGWIRHYIPSSLASYKQRSGIDGASIGGIEEQVWYGFGRIEGEGASRVYPWIEHAQRMNDFTVEALFRQWI